MKETLGRLLIWVSEEKFDQGSHSSVLVSTDNTRRFIPSKSRSSPLSWRLLDESSHVLPKARASAPLSALPAFIATPSCALAPASELHDRNNGWRRLKKRPQLGISWCRVGGFLRDANGGIGASRQFERPKTNCVVRELEQCSIRQQILDDR